ncbi:MAG: HAMP domain-containing protein [Anaerolineales bacterium]|nr:HAMP domain-containing protein [Anaerolineales bacterium]
MTLRSTDHTFLRRRLLPAIVGALLYAGLNWVTTIFPLAAAGDVNIRPGIVIPLFYGFMFGPYTGFFVGLAGNLTGDLLSGVVSFPVASLTGNAFLDFANGTFLPWQFGNGLVGAIPGLFKRLDLQYERLRDFAYAIGIGALAILIGMGSASILTVALGVDAAFVFSQYFIPATWSNIYNMVFLLPLLLHNYAHFSLDKVGVFRFGYMRRILLLILGSAAIPAALLGLFLVQPAGSGASFSQVELLVKLVLIVLLTLLFVIVNTSMLGQRISSILLEMARAAHQLERNELSRAEAAALIETPGDDEISQLSRTFGRMAKETILREEKMRRHIRQLRIEIDRSKTAREVNAITETDYFQQLERKVDELRLQMPGNAPDNLQNRAS